MTDDKKSTPWWQILTVAFVIVFISVVIVLSLVFENERWKISAEIVTCILFLIIICASFFFDSIQIGKISLLKNEIKEKESLILNLQNLVFSNQNLNKNIVNNTFSIGKNEDKEEKLEAQAEEENVSKNISKEKKELQKEKIKNAEQQFILNYCTDRGIKRENLQEDVKIIENGNLDPISLYTPIFDYYNDCGVNSEFIVFKFVSSNFYLIKFQLYMMLSKIYLYNKFSKNNNSLKLVLLQKNSKKEENYSKLIKQDFYPAYNSLLLSIESINL